MFLFISMFTELKSELKITSAILHQPSYISTLSPHPSTLSLHPSTLSLHPSALTPRFIPSPHKKRLTPKRQPFSLSFLFYSDPKIYAIVLIISYLHILFLCKNIKNTVFLPLIKRKRLRQTITPVLPATFIRQLPFNCHLSHMLLKLVYSNIRQTLAHF